MLLRHSLIVLAFVFMTSAAMPASATSGSASERASTPVVEVSAVKTRPDVRIAKRRRRVKRKKRSTPTPPRTDAPPTGDPAASAPPAAAPSPSAAPEPDDGGLSPIRRGPSRIDFDERMIKGQTNKANAIYLFERRSSGMRTLVQKRGHFHEEIDDTLR